jgi:hypothetical protein
MKSFRGFWIALAAACALGTSVGCYTMLKHPRLKIDDRTSHAEEYYYDDEAISFADDCASCHSPGSLRAHHRAVPPPRRLVSPTWDYYYEYPWWIPSYNAGNTDADAPEGEQKKRPFDRRRQSRPEEPAAPSTTSVPASPSPAPVPATVAKPADTGAQPSTPPKTENTNKREEKDSGKSKSGERRTRKP